MTIDLGLLNAVIAVAKAGGFREAARATNSNPSRLSDAVRRAEQQLGVRLFNRTTRTVMLTDAGKMLLDRLLPAMSEVESAIDAVNGFRTTPTGTLRLNVPVSAARLVLPSIVPLFIAKYPDIELEIMADSNVMDIFSAGYDAGIRYDEKLEQDMIAVPIGPRSQRFAIAAAPAYLNRRGRPQHPRDLLHHACMRGKYASGIIPEWVFENDGEVVRLQPTGPLIVNIGSGMDLAVETALAGQGIIQLFEEWLAPHFASGALEPVLEPWWLPFSGPYLYYPGRRLVPAPLRAFIDFIRERQQR